MATPDPGLPRNIGAPAMRALTAAGYTKLSQLADVPAVVERIKAAQKAARPKAAKPPTPF